MLLFLLACGPASLDVADTPKPDSSPERHDSDPPEDTSPPEDTGPFDADGDGWPAAEDCDDGDPTRHPGAVEVCDGIDSDCDGIVDKLDAEDAVIVYVDTDGDGYGVSSSGAPSCGVPEGWSLQGNDCDDGDEDVHPKAPDDTPDGVDNDCDGRTDEDWTCEGYGAGSLSFDGPASIGYAPGKSANAGSVTGYGWMCSVACDDSAVAEAWLSPSASCSPEVELPAELAWGNALALCVTVRGKGETRCAVTGALGEVGLTVVGR